MTDKELLAKAERNEGLTVDEIKSHHIQKVQLIYAGWTALKEQYKTKN